MASLMVKRADRLIAFSVLGTLLLVWLVLAGFDSLLQFVRQLGNIGKNGFSLYDAIAYIMLTLPRRLYQMFSNAALIGGLLGLGGLAATGELTALRAAGMSKLRIAASAVGVIAVLTLAVVVMGETAAPFGDQHAQAIQVRMRSSNLGSTSSGLWARDGGKIVIARKGVAMYDIVVRGRASHAGTRPQDGRSAVRAAARLVLDLEALNDAGRGITVTVGTISGGTGRNTVPAECRMQVDVRVPDDAAATEVTAKIAAMQPVDPDISFEIKGQMNRPPFAQSDAGRRLFDTAAKIAVDLGIALEGVTTGGGSDGNFTAALGVPTLDGLGADGAGAHTFEEYILLSSVAPRTALLANLMMSLEPEA